MLSRSALLFCTPNLHLTKMRIMIPRNWTPDPRFSRFQAFSRITSRPNSLALTSTLAGFKKMSTLELFEVLDLFYWVTALSQSPDDPRTFELAAGTMGVLTVIQPKFGKIPKGVCLHRIWNAAKSSPRGLVEIVTLEAMISDMSISDHHLNKHHSCTIQVCLENDEHTTNIPQLHVLCADAGSCLQIEFDVECLNRLENLDEGATAWDLSGKDPAVGAERYVALSHVWSDGTGVGPKRTGSVNRCLVQFWKDIVGSTKDPCSAIWWDTISLPTEREKRNKALSQMHANYNRAEWTLVHNRELADFTWQDDGSPCVALILSTWFSRGWTALELLASNSVRVLFKDPAGNRLLKDLDSEILARVGDGSTHPAHRAASAVIRRLRPRPRALETLPEVYASFEQLMSCMRSRYTCWARDRIIILGLLVGKMRGEANWFDPSWPIPTFTMNLLDKVKQVGHRGLMHNQTPMSEEGPWSWCPPSIYHLEDNFDQRDHQHEFSLVQRTSPLLLHNGELWGRWEVRRLWATDQKTLVPYAAHDYQFFRVQSALQSPRGHFLLSTLDSKRSYERYVLVRWLDESSELSQLFSPDSYPKLEPLPSMMWKFRFVGTVMGSVNDTIDSFTSLGGVGLC